MIDLLQARPETLRREHAIIGKVSKLPSSCYDSFLQNYPRLYFPSIFFVNNGNVQSHKFYAFLNSLLVFQNQQLWDLGLATSDMEKEEKVDAKIAELSAQFDFVLLAEFFDEGLVILARLLCWELEDVRHKTPIRY